MDIPVQHINEFLPIESSTTNYRKVANRIFVYCFCCSQWSKATMYFGSQFLKTAESNRILGFWHMFLGSIAMNVARRQQFRYFPLCFRKLILRILYLNTIAMIMDEIWAVLIMFLTNKRYSVQGKRTISSANECMICLQESEEELQAFCLSNHCAHRSCMEQWYKPVYPHQSCPMCRQEMQLKVLKVFHFGWTPQFYQSFFRRLYVSLQCAMLMTALYVGQMFVLNWRLKVALGYLKGSV
jgi:hypothetical protein